MHEQSYSCRTPYIPDPADHPPDTPQHKPDIPSGNERVVQYKLKVPKDVENV